jgi:hypothetical protein
MAMWKYILLFFFGVSFALHAITELGHGQAWSALIFMVMGIALFGLGLKVRKNQIRQ